MAAGAGRARERRSPDTLKGRWALARVEENVAALADEALLVHVPADDRPAKVLTADILHQSQGG